MYKFEGPESIKVKRIAKAGYFGISSYAKSVTTIGCEISSKGFFKTGLDAEMEKHYESELSLKPGELNKHSKWWSDVFNVTHSLRFFNTKTNEIMLDNPINQIKYLVLMNSSKIANSEIEKTPGTIFFIDNAEAKAQAELEVYNYEFEAMGLVYKLSPDDKRTNLRLFGKTGLDNVSEAMLNAQLMQEMKKDPKLFVETLLDKDAKTKGLINELVEKNIIRRKGTHFIYNEDTIAHSTEECVDYFNNKSNDKVTLILKSKLNKAKNIKEVTE